jgi:hypothetical protein
MKHSEFQVWETYKELKNDYSLNAPRPNNANYYEQEGKTIFTHSEYAIFSYGAERCKQELLKQLNSVYDPDKTIIESFASDIDVLIDDFKDKVKTDWAGKPNENLSSIGEKFLEDASAMIKKYEPKLESQASWKPFLKNALLLISVIGTLPALFSIGMKAVTGKYSFFDRKSISDEQLQMKLPSQEPKADSYELASI